MVCLLVWVFCVVLVVCRFLFSCLGFDLRVFLVFVRWFCWFVFGLWIVCCFLCFLVWVLVMLGSVGGQ